MRAGNDWKEQQQQQKKFRGFGVRIEQEQRNNGRGGGGGEEQNWPELAGSTQPLAANNASSYQEQKDNTHRHSNDTRFEVCLVELVFSLCKKMCVVVVVVAAAVVV